MMCKCSIFVFGTLDILFCVFYFFMYVFYVLFYSFFSRFSTLSKNKEKLYIKAVNNLRKQKNYLQLIIELESEMITEEEFEEELNANEKRYLIEIEDKEDNLDLEQIFDIVQNVEGEITESDISELFSISIDKVSHFIESFRSLRRIDK